MPSLKGRGFSRAEWANTTRPIGPEVVALGG